MNHFAKIAAQLESRDLDGMLLTHEANRFYASGFHSAGTDGMALVTREKFYYFTDSRYTEAARDIIRQAGYGPCFGHSFGHGVGVEIHEGPNATPSNDKPLPAGAVISAEPGIYLPGKLGVRIEDVLYLTPEGCQNLTLAPKELVIL